MTNPDSKYYIPVHKRAELLVNDITLNGVPATLSGLKNDFATVKQYPNGLSAEFAWWTVKHVIEHSKGEFNA
jgi:hypothetical protein